MRVLCDIEADSLKPTKIHCIVAKDIDNDDYYYFDPSSLHNFADFARRVTLWIGHNFLGYDLWALNKLIPGVSINPRIVIDTLIVSRLVNFRRDGGHSLESYGESYGIPKVQNEDWSVFTPHMLERCKQDVEINLGVWKEHYDFIHDPDNRPTLRTEHDIAVVCHEMSTNGFHFNITEAKKIYDELEVELSRLSEDISRAFPPRSVLVREVVPRSTKSGTLHAGDFRWVEDGNLLPFSVGAAFSRIAWRDFNPASPKQIVERFNEFGWNPYIPTDGHADAKRDLQNIKRALRNADRQRLPLGRLIELRNQEAELEEKLKEYEIYGWKISEENLATLPETAPPAAWLLIKWKLLEKRRQTLEEWFSAYSDSTGRIHGNFNGIGTWTHRFSHSSPNMGNVPSVDSKYNSPELKERAKHYGVKLRSLWSVPNRRRLVGVDAEGIQLRVLAHYINDNAFTTALISGDKDAGTDVHTLNAIKLGLGPRGRPNAKTFIYAWLLGAGLDKVAKILDTDRRGAEVANENFLEGYPGLRQLKEYDIPYDVDRGYYVGFDGRKVPCESEHLMLAGYLQTGESVVMKRATLLWKARLEKEKIPYKLVNYVHDEWQTETEDDDDIANYIANIQMDAIKQVGLDLGIRCPLSGSKSLGYTWYDTH